MRSTFLLIFVVLTVCDYGAGIQFFKGREFMRGPHIEIKMMNSSTTAKPHLTNNATAPTSSVSDDGSKLVQTSPSHKRFKSNKTNDDVFHPENNHPMEHSWELLDQVDQDMYTGRNRQDLHDFIILCAFGLILLAMFFAFSQHLVNAQP